MPIGFGDNVQVVATPVTIQVGLAGLGGQVFGETTPSVTRVEVVGEATADYAFNVQLEGRPDSVWFAPELLELVDHAPGTEVVIGNKRFVRSESGEWTDETTPAPSSLPSGKPWWRFW